LSGRTFRNGLKGKIRVRHDDGTEIVITAGDAYSLAPGHDAWVEEDEAVKGYEFNNTARIMQFGEN